jgi:abortive infection bacteriophage resistance protein
VRAQIAHVLGRRDPFGHLDKRRLDPGAANRYRAGQGHTAFDRWLEEYERLQSRARKETFVAHNLAKYGPPLPIWIACEFLNFGAVSNLYQLLKYDDRQQIASDAGLRHERTLRGWLIALNYLRNVCAHNQRIWNRVLVVKPSLKGKDLPGDLSHLAGASNGRLYPASAITAHLLRTLSLASGWRDKMAETLDRFPDSTGWAVTDMGTPANWRALPIWSY